MKIGVITDIHSNIDALNAVLNKFQEIQVDKIICCGDIIGIGINPEETVQALLRIKDMLIAVRGNHEQYLLEGLPKVVHNDRRVIGNEEVKNHKWNQSKLSDISKKYLKFLKTSQNIEIDGKRIYIVHYPQKEDGTYKKHIKNPTINEIEEMFNGISADIFLFGHTHTFSVNNMDNKWYINTASLGCPMDSNIAKAGLIEIDRGRIEFKRINVEYDVKKVIEKIKKLKFPFYKEILKIFYGVNEL